MPQLKRLRHGAEKKATTDFRLGNAGADFSEQGDADEPVVVVRQTGKVVRGESFKLGPCLRLAAEFAVEIGERAPSGKGGILL